VETSASGYVPVWAVVNNAMNLGFHKGRESLNQLYDSLFLRNAAAWN
jgi:hypothetical protein